MRGRSAIDGVGEKASSSSVRHGGLSSCASWAAVAMLSSSSCISSGEHAMDGVGVPGVAAREYAIDGVGVATPLSDALNEAPGTSSLHLTPGVPGVRPGVYAGAGAADRSS